MYSHFYGFFNCKKSSLIYICKKKHDEQHKKSSMEAIQGLGNYDHVHLFNLCTGFIGENTLLESLNNVCNTVILEIIKSCTTFQTL